KSLCCCMDNPHANAHKNNVFNRHFDSPSFMPSCCSSFAMIGLLSDGPQHQPRSYFENVSSLLSGLMTYLPVSGSMQPLLISMTTYSRAIPSYFHSGSDVSSAEGVKRQTIL